MSRQKTSVSASTSPGDSGQPEERADHATTSGKGRPTPKRRDAERGRRTRMTPPKDRRQAAAQARQRTREERRRMRAALLSGDTRNLPPRDAGAVRGFVRDYVDSRRNAAGLFVPGTLVVFALGQVPQPITIILAQLALLAMFALVLVDSALLVRGLRQAVRERFPTESHQGITGYALLRSMQIRRLRLPPPRVKRGEKI